MKNSTILLYTLTGVAVGLTLGILLAPKTGEETRKRLRKSADDLRKRMRLNGEDEFSATEMEMDATSGRGEWM